MPKNRCNSLMVVGRFCFRIALTRSGNGGYRTCLPCKWEIQERFCPGRISCNWQPCHCRPGPETLVWGLRDAVWGFGGDQDVVNTDECVWNVAEYFVHKALKSCQMECAEAGTTRTKLWRRSFFFFYIFFRDGNLVIAFKQGDFAKYCLSCENVAEVGKAPHWVLLICCLDVELAVIAANAPSAAGSWQCACAWADAWFLSYH